MAGSHVEVLAGERGVTGIEEPIYHYGKLVGTRIKRSDCIFRMLLMASNRKKFGRMGAVKRKEIELELRAQIKLELRAEVEADVRKRLLPRVASDEEVREALMKALTAFGEREAAAAEDWDPFDREEGRSSGKVTGQESRRGLPGLLRRPNMRAIKQGEARWRKRSRGRRTGRGR